MENAAGEKAILSAPPRRRRLLAACLGALAMGAVALWWFGRSPPPEPPAVDTTGREPEIVAAVEAARDAARKQPGSGAAWGKLGLVLLAHDFEPEARVC